MCIQVGFHTGQRQSNLLEEPAGAAMAASGHSMQEDEPARG